MYLFLTIGTIYAVFLSFFLVFIVKPERHPLLIGPLLLGGLYVGVFGILESLLYIYN